MASEAMRESLSLTIQEASQTAEARRRIVDLARCLSFTETELGQLALVITEAATNLLKHARAGELVVRVLEGCGMAGIEILALDRGPGMANVAACLRDGYSTTGSPGTGLGAITRLSTEFDIYSQPSQGTALLMRLWRSPPAHLVSTPPIEAGVVCVAKHGEPISGDAWAVEATVERAIVLIADGLGHGPDAAMAANTAVRVLHAHPGLSPGELVERANGALRPTRGAALGIAEVSLATQSVRYAGIGNIAGAIILPGRNQHLASHNGIVGHAVRKIQEFTYLWSPEALLILHSDGLATHWDLNTYPGLTTRHPGLIAGVLYRDFARGRDDVTVMVAKEAHAFR
jgi:anti-sigma regulatory factor (Ser/Thr protein kinase)